jgi:hypothetical protein
MINHRHTTEYGLHSAITHRGRRCPVEHRWGIVPLDQNCAIGNSLSHTGFLFVPTPALALSRDVNLLIAELSHAVLDVNVQIVGGLDTKQRSSAQGAVLSQPRRSFSLSWVSIRRNTQCQETAVLARPR